jgi:endonuclease YncB( thermonuclease family)
MRLWVLVLATLLIFPLACGGMHGGASTAATIARVLDGDTIVLTDGRHVRLVQLDAPETDQDECYAAEAKAVLIRLLPFGTEVEIETDPTLDKRDRFGRILAYVARNGTNINLELVREGAASPYFFHGDRGRYARPPRGGQRSQPASARALGRLFRHRSRSAPRRPGPKLAICKSRPADGPCRQENDPPWPKRE